MTSPPEKLNADDVLGEERERLGYEPDGASALCLSGGGVRSASFCLGVLQALASAKLLTGFNYLSTVSGGGYIAGWLVKCIAEANESLAGSPRSPDDALDSVVRDVLQRPGSLEPLQVHQLRRYTNFLMPRAGFASADTWADIVLWLRNTLVNWLVFLPLFLALAFCPILYFVSFVGLSRLDTATVPLTSNTGQLLARICGFAGMQSLLSTHNTADPTQFFIRLIVIVGVLCLFASLLLTLLSLPGSRNKPAPQASATDRRWAIPAHVRQPYVIVGLAVVWSWCVPLSDANIATWTQADAQHDKLLPALALVTSLAAYGVAAALRSRLVVRTGTGRTAAWRIVGWDIGGWTLGSVLAALGLWLGIRLAHGADPLWPVILGPVWVMMCGTLGFAVYVAMRRASASIDLDREWIARLNGTKLAVTILFAVIAGSALYLPVLVFGPMARLHPIYLSVLGLATGPMAALIGKSAKTAFSAVVPSSAVVEQTYTSILVRLSMPLIVSVFAASLMTLSGVADMGATEFLVVHLPIRRAIGLALTTLLLGAALIGFALIVDVLVNLNDFSMHGVYRNRLVRGFLGSARLQAKREATEDRYTHFDPVDDLRLADGWDANRKRLFPVINVALNRTSGMGTARAERMAEPFTITPLHCGSPYLDNRLGAYVRTEHYACGDKQTGMDDEQNGIRLGSAMTISGATVSPNRGYNSSPSTAFLMTLFNVRLGAWLPNPAARRRTLRLMHSNSPRFAIRYLLSELFGRSDAAADYVYLSDGGHYDNLGLYEMLRRRCRRIMVIDATMDGLYDYCDLGRVVQHALIDLNIAIAFGPPLKMGNANLGGIVSIATVAYPARDGLHAAPAFTGDLIYVKPWLPDDMPVELQAFKRSKSSFPHEATADQFFTESDFESYRRLGEFIAGQMVAEAERHDWRRSPDDQPTVEWLFEALCDNPHRLRA